MAQPGSGKKIFYVCEFAGGELSVVPSDWIFKKKEKLLCRWTPYLEKIKRACIPNPSWQVLEIIRLLDKRGSYESVDACLSDIRSDSPVTGIDVEDVASDDPTEHLSLPEKRHRKTRRLSTDSSHCDGGSSPDTSQQGDRGESPEKTKDIV